MVKTILDIEGLLGLNLLTLDLGLSHSGQASLLLNLRFRLVLAQKAKGLGGYTKKLEDGANRKSRCTSVLVKGAGELVDGWGNL
jgi:hypothetical protein